MNVDGFGRGGEAEVGGLDYGVQAEGGAGLSLAPGAVAAVYAEEGGEDFVGDGLACAVALEGREGFGCHWGGLN